MKTYLEIIFGSKKTNLVKLLYLRRMAMPQFSVKKKKNNSRHRCTPSELIFILELKFVHFLFFLFLSCLSFFNWLFHSPNKIFFSLSSSLFTHSTHLLTRLFLQCHEVLFTLLSKLEVLLQRL